MTRERTGFALGVVCTFALSASSALGAPPIVDPSEAKADALFRVGTEMLDAGRVSEACDALDQSLRVDPKLGTLLNLGLCHEKLGKSATAWAEFSDAAVWAADAGQTDRRDFARQHAAALERSLARVQLRLPSGNALVVEIDGDVVPESRRSLPLFVDPGHHALKVTARGKQPFATDLVTVAPSTASHGSTGQIVAVPNLADEGPAAAAARDSRGVPCPTLPLSLARRRVAGLSLGAAGVVGLGVGIAFGARTLSKFGDASAHCGAMGCDAEGRSALDQGKTAEAVSLVSLTASALAVGAGIWLWLSARPLETSYARIRIAPLVEARGGGVDVAGTW